MNSPDESDTESLLGVMGLPFAPWGLRELNIFGWPLLIAIGILVWLGGAWQWLAAVPAVALAFLLYFFRDPRRKIPAAADAFVAPADGKVVEVSRLANHDFFGKPALRIGIFLSLLDVHVNRAPWAGRVVELRHQPGQFLNAMNPASAERNESMWIGLEEIDQPQRRFAVRQVAGLLARRIVCNLRPGQTVRRGEKFGMIKFGSRTELILPADEVAVEVQIGDHVRGGSSIVAKWLHAAADSAEL